MEDGRKKKKEEQISIGRNCCEVVAPFAGAWIEILQKLIINVSNASLPSRERGLKYQVISPGLVHFRRSLRGSVD